MSEQKEVVILTADLAREAAAFCGWENLYGALRAIATGQATVISAAEIEAKDAVVRAAKELLRMRPDLDWQSFAKARKHLSEAIDAIAGETK